MSSRSAEMGQAENLHPGVNGVDGVHRAQTQPAAAAAAAALFDSIEDTVAAFGLGSFVIVLDSTQRENEGDLIIAAEAATTDKIAFMVRHTSGYICAPISEARADGLALPAMVAANEDPNRTAYTVTVDALGAGVTTGISARDRAHTLRALADPDAVADSFRRPGHVVPLRAREGGVRARYGHTEAALELCRLAGLRPAAAICEMVVDGEEVAGKPVLVGSRMMRRDDCLAFGRRFGIRVCTIEDMVAYVERKEGKLDQAGVDY